MISERTLELRTKVYHAYGGVCVECGEGDHNKLTLDHKAGGGNEERRLKQKYGFVKYVDLIKEQYPQHLQLLCMNCNHAKGLSEEGKKQETEVEDVPEGSYQLNSAVSKEVYSYVKAQKSQRKCTEKQILEEMYASHIGTGSKSYQELLGVLQGYAAEMQARSDKIIDVLEMIQSAVCPPVEAPPPVVEVDPFAHLDMSKPLAAVHVPVLVEITPMTPKSGQKFLRLIYAFLGWSPAK